jgi:hypothetical protein
MLLFSSDALEAMQQAAARTSRSFTMLGWSSFLSTAISRTTSFGVLPLMEITLDRRSGLPSVAGVTECRFSSCRAGGCCFRNVRKTC